MDLDNDIAFQEWKSCLGSLERFDNILVDLRKFGFSLITVLLSGSGFLFTQASVGPFAVTGVYVALLVLIAGLFRQDRIHEVFIRGCALRAMEIEDTRAMGQTFVVSYWSERLRTGTWGHYLYLLFCVAALSLAISGVLNADGLAEMRKWAWICVLAIAGVIAGYGIWKQHSAALAMEQAFVAKVNERAAREGRQQIT